MSRGNIDLNAQQAAALGAAIAHRRITIGYKSARSLAQHIDLDYRTITAIENGQPRAVDRNTLMALEVGLSWPAGTIMSIIAGTGDDGNLRIRPPQTRVDAQIVAAALGVAQAAFDAYIAAQAP